MRHLLTLLLTLILMTSAVAWADEPTQRDVSDLLATLRSPQIVRVAYTEHVNLPFLKHPLESRGELVIHPDGHLIRKVTAPKPSTAVVTQSRVIVQDGSGTTTIDTSAAPEVVAAIRLLRAVLTGEVKVMKDRYDIAVEAPSDQKSWSVTLTSRKGKSNFFGKCVVNGEGDQVQTVTLNETDGVIRRIDFEAAQTSAELDTAEQKLLKTATAGE